MAAGRLRRDWDQLDRRTCRALQATRLRRYLSQVVVPFSAFYRERFAQAGVDPLGIRSLEDLERIPFTTKRDLVRSLEDPVRKRDFIAIPDPSILARRLGVVLRGLFTGRRRVRAAFEREYRPIFLTSTTGRSAQSIPFVYTARDLDNLALAGRRLIQVSGARRDERFMNLFPFAPHLAFWQAHYATVSDGMFCLSTGGGRTMGTERTVALLEKVRPAGVIAMPTFLYHVLHQAAEKGRRIDSLRTLVLGGEQVPAGLRRKLRTLAAALGSTDARVVATYGFTEAKMAWAECVAHVGAPPTGYHLYPDLGLFEVVDPATGEVVPDGHPGELVYTTLNARGTVVVRYRTGDVIDGGLTYQPCPSCHRVVPRLVGTISRRSNVRLLRLAKVKGALVDFNALEHVLDDVEHVGAWQLELRKLHDDPMEVDQLILHVHRITDIDEAELTRELDRLFVARTEIRPNEIVYLSAAELRRLQGVGQELKEKRLVDNRPRAAAVPAAATSA